MDTLTTLLQISLQLDSVDEVNAMHTKALELGGKCEGPPGFRSETFYGAYFRDLDGNKLCCFHTKIS
jgi:predicted lactoylglutathione lyase